jgi:SNF2 family DNA or RNA helicase
LDIKGHRYIEYHGGMTSRARERAVTKFETDDEIRIMIISNVGSTGLNLMVASVVIFVVSELDGNDACIG